MTSSLVRNSGFSRWTSRGDSSPQGFTSTASSMAQKIFLRRAKPLADRDPDNLSGLVLVAFVAEANGCRLAAFFKCVSVEIAVENSALT